MVQKFINRPVLSTVLSILICLVGVLGLATLPVAQYPDIAPPMVRVSATYPGANAETVLKSVIAPLEEQINGVENMTYISSTAGNDGTATIEVYFEVGVDPDMASVNVQNRVSAAQSKLPADVIENGVLTEKQQNNMLLVISIYSTNPDYDATFVENYARINLYPDLQRVTGVGRINVFGARTYAMRVWMDPVKMAAYGLIPSDISAVIAEQNLEAAPGKFGQNTDEAFEYTIKYTGKFTTEEEYGEMVIKTDERGNLLKLKDVAEIELGAYDYSTSASAQGYPAVNMAAYQIAGSNAQDVVIGLKDAVESASKTFPEGIKYSYTYDTNRFLEESINKVIHTFFEAFLLVFIVVYVFLQDLRSTLIPVISSLVAIIGTFFFLQIFGFSINLLTLFALILAIGIVVDDAIVVVEAVHAKMEHGLDGMSLKEATSGAMKEITGAIISITFVMSAVFFPVSFTSGPVGIFYRQFALTLAVAILLSAVNALTLSPVLCVLLIKPKGHSKKMKAVARFQEAFDAGFDVLVSRYKAILHLFERRRFLPVGLLTIFGGLLYYLMVTTPTGFIPNEDQGIAIVDISLPPGASLDRTEKTIAILDSIVAAHPAVEGRINVAGVSILSGSNGGSYGLQMLNLTDWAERPDHTVDQITAELTQQAAEKIKDGRVLFFVPPPVPGFGISDGFEMNLQDRTGGDLTAFNDVTNQFIYTLMQQPEILYGTTSFNTNFPQYMFDVDVDKCKLSGISVGDVFMTLQGYYGSMFVSDFNRFTKYFRVAVQSKPEERRDLASLEKIMVRNSLGEMVPITSVVNFERVYGAEAINRYNLFTSAKINGAAKPGFSTGQSIEAVRRAAESLPNGYTYEFSGMTREEINAAGTQSVIFALCFIFVYLILCAQYESYILPWSVMVPLVIGICGVYIFISMFGIESNIYVQVALIMLLGLLAKNGILIVEFARQRRDLGMSVVDSAIEGAVARLRPILMTSFAFIFGMIPLAIATGAGSVGNRSIGIAAAGGMLIGTLFGVVVIPSMYIIFQNLDDRLRGNKADVEEVENN